MKSEFDTEGFEPGSIIWVKVEDVSDIEEMTKRIEALDLDQFVFIVTGPKAKLECLSVELLKHALNLSTQLKSKENQNIH